MSSPIEIAERHCSICDFDEESNQPVYANPLEDPDDTAYPFLCRDCLNLVTALEAREDQRWALTALAEDFEARRGN